MENITKIYDFAVLVVAILAAVGGTAYLFYDGHTIFGIANIFLVAMAYPFVSSRLKDILL